jgi:dipeptidyl aminopeptidase/acylaminoacyl peptidase
MRRRRQILHLVLFISLLAFVPTLSTRAQQDQPTVTPTAAGQFVVTKLAYVSRRSGNAQIFVVNADGSNPVNVSNNTTNETQPAWSPDGTQLGFVSDRNGNRDVCIMDADGKNQRCLTNNVTPSGKFDPTIPEDYSPTWSTDGKLMAFISTRTGSAEVFGMNTDGSNQINLTQSGVNNDSPVWSPDLKKIAYTTTRNGNSDVCVMDASGFNQRCLTNNRTPDKKPNKNRPEDRSPSWSPDSTRLVFVSTRDRNSEIYIMNVDGSRPINVSRRISSDETPSWSPDGTQIAFVSNRNGLREVFVMAADGKNQRPLVVKTIEEEIQPNWAPGAFLQTTPTETLTYTPTGTIIFTKIPTETPTSTLPPPVIFITNTRRPSVTPVVPTSVPPTSAPPTAVPPTAIPPSSTSTTIPTVTPSDTLQPTATSSNTPTVTITATDTATNTFTPTTPATFTPSPTPTSTDTALGCPLIVTSLANSGAGTLRDTIACAPDGSTITFAVTGTILLNSRLNITKALTIDGPGPSSITVNAQGLDAVFTTQPPGGVGGTTNPPVTLRGMTVTGGVGFNGAGLYNSTLVTVDNMIFEGNEIPQVRNQFHAGGGMTIINTIIRNNVAGSTTTGGGLNSNGTLSITDSTITSNTATTGGGLHIFGDTATLTRTTITGNTATGAGGGIAVTAAGTLNLIESTISTNTSSGSGGGINSDGALTVTRSTLNGNRANGGNGAGINANNGTLTMVNSTLSGNVASSTGGGTFINGNTNATIRFSTLYQNQATSGGNVQQAGISTFTASIFAGGTGTNPDINGNFTSGGFNLIQNVAGTGGQIGSDITGVDPQLGALANNGGLTQTHLPAFSSPVLNTVTTGGVCNITTDQRGIDRPQASICDTGSVEREPPGVPPTAAPIVPTIAPTLTFTPVVPTLTPTMPLPGATPTETPTATGTPFPTFTPLPMETPTETPTTIPTIAPATEAS